MTADPFFHNLSLLWELQVSRLISIIRVSDDVPFLNNQCALLLQAAVGAEVALGLFWWETFDLVDLQFCRQDELLQPGVDSRWQTFGI